MNFNKIILLLITFSLVEAPLLVASSHEASSKGSAPATENKKNRLPRKRSKRSVFPFSDFESWIPLIVGGVSGTVALGLAVRYGYHHLIKPVGQSSEQPFTASQTKGDVFKREVTFEEPLQTSRESTSDHSESLQVNLLKDRPSSHNDPIVNPSVIPVVPSVNNNQPTVISVEPSVKNTHLNNAASLEVASVNHLPVIQATLEGNVSLGTVVAPTVIPVVVQGEEQGVVVRVGQREDQNNAVARRDSTQSAPTNYTAETASTARTNSIRTPEVQDLAEEVVSLRQQAARSSRCQYMLAALSLLPMGISLGVYMLPRLLRYYYSLDTYPLPM